MPVFALVMLGKLIAAAPAAPSMIASRREIPLMLGSPCFWSLLFMGFAVALISIRVCRLSSHTSSDGLRLLSSMVTPVTDSQNIFTARQFRKVDNHKYLNG